MDGFTFGLILVAGGTVGVLFQLDGVLRGHRGHFAHCKQEQEPDSELTDVLHNSLQLHLCTTVTARWEAVPIVNRTCKFLILSSFSETECAGNRVFQTG